ncbi:hypothetical protein PHISCL_09521 [Aspergillus sclerotialis]|uniref:Uncharacterized protein n=1 Tax=Aspergillus sclerotialis TaxID=2070753 RepID=A0A3A2Z7H3_9EURO|nr:hypothetical protein PHISCL_09521 [Aspergillus sclerotialis]
MFTSILDQPFVDLYQFSYPKFGPTWIVQVKDNNKQQPSHSHLKVLIYNNLDGVDGKLYRGEVILALRLMAAQLRRLRFIKHLVAPVLLFSFMGPQHARIIEAFFTGTTLVLRPSRLYDFREKDQAAFRHFAQWYFGKPIGDTMALPESSD